MEYLVQEKYERVLQESLMQLCETMRNAPIYAGVETTMAASCEGMIRIHQEQNGRLVNNFDFIQILMVG